MIDVVCPICKGKKTVKTGDGKGETIRVHTCLRCYGSGINKFQTVLPTANKE